MRITRVTVGCSRRQRAAVISDEGVRLGAEAARRLARTGLHEFEPGLTDAEFERIEREHGFEFADDHRAFLAAGLPVNVPPEDGQTWSRPWPEWRDGDLDGLRRQLAWPVEGVLLDVECNGFWYEGWGERPADGAAALDAARHRLAEVPVLVPVYAHRYLPAGRGSVGHPVLSMWQTDIIYYGLDLVDYMHQEFNEARDEVDEGWTPRATVPFWRDLLQLLGKPRHLAGALSLGSCGPLRPVRTQTWANGRGAGSSVSVAFTVIPRCSPLDPVRLRCGR